MLLVAALSLTMPILQEQLERAQQQTTHSMKAAERAGSLLQRSSNSSGVREKPQHKHRNMLMNIFFW
jgi:hypothetical protein